MDGLDVQGREWRMQFASSVALWSCIGQRCSQRLGSEIGMCFEVCGTALFKMLLRSIMEKC